MTEMKFCKDCAHAERFGCEDVFGSANCLRLVGTPTFNPVTGHRDPEFGVRCHRERAALKWLECIFGTKRCGPDGRYFTERNNDGRE